MAGPIKSIVIKDKATAKLKFESKIKILENGCWIWQGKTDGHYGSYQGVAANRYSYTLYKGTIPKGLFACHNCPTGDNQLCVNPDHLFLGTQKDNIQDCLAKGRFNHGTRGSPRERNGAVLHPETLKRGEDNFKAKLTEEQVEDIRKRYVRVSHNVSNGSELAKEFGVSKRTICNIAMGRFWKHSDTRLQGVK